MCNFYSARIDAGVISCLRYNSTNLIKSEGFCDIDLLPVAALKNINLKHIDLSDGTLSVVGAKIITEIITVVIMYYQYF